MHARSKHFGESGGEECKVGVPARALRRGRLDPRLWVDARDGRRPVADAPERPRGGCGEAISALDRRARLANGAYEPGCPRYRAEGMARHAEADHRHGRGDGAAPVVSSAQPARQRARAVPYRRRGRPFGSITWKRPDACSRLIK